MNEVRIIYYLGGICIWEKKNPPKLEGYFCNFKCTKHQYLVITHANKIPFNYVSIILVVPNSQIVALIS